MISFGEQLPPSVIVSMTLGFINMSMVIILEILLQFLSEDTPWEVEGEWDLSLPLTEAFVLSGNFSSKRGERRDDLWWLSSQVHSLIIMASRIASSNKKVSLKKSWDGEDGMFSHSGRDYWSSSFSCEKQTLDSVSNCIAKYDNLDSDKNIVSP